MVLLDSHVLLWVLSGRGNLGADAKRVLEEAERVYVSAASVWELTIKSMPGKLRIPPDFATTLRDQGLFGLPISLDHAEGIREFPEIAAHDPFDRLLVAQAHQEGLRLATADRVLVGLGRPFIFDATR
jgi:PIN domain nuclease of toxin-antitoxin system